MTQSRRPAGTEGALAGFLPALTCATLALALAGPASAAPLAIRAAELHLGDGRVLKDGIVLFDAGRIKAVGPAASVKLPAGCEIQDAAAVTPGLVASLVEPDYDDVDMLSIDPDRIAVELQDPFEDPSPFLARGITALAVSPGSSRLVSGRGGVLRATSSPTGRIALRLGPQCVSLSASALDPPLRFEPDVPVNVDNPLSPASPQRPHLPLTAVAELRRLLRSPAAPWPDLAAGRLSLRIHADREADLRHALALAREFPLRLVIEGATEGWKLAPELAVAKALVVLEVDDPSLPVTRARSRGEVNLDSAAILAAAGVRLALGSAQGGEPADPLLLAASAVRHGLGAGPALACVTSMAAAAMGLPELGMLQAGAPADLVLWSASPLSISAQAESVFVGGELRHAREPSRDAPPLALRVGTLRANGDILHDAVLVARAGLVTSAGPSSALPAGTLVRDFGPDSVLVPGFIDAFSHAGQESGPQSGGGARTRAADAIEKDEPSLMEALRAGLTSALIQPPGGGPLRGQACVASLALLRADEVPPVSPLKIPPPPVDALRLELISTDAGFVFSYDEGPDDQGARAMRLEALKGVLSRAKSYHDQWEKHDKKDDSKGKDKAAKGKAGKKKEPKEPPQKDPQLEPLRALFTGKTKAFLRAGRHDSILEALDAMQESGVVPVLVGGEEADLVKDELVKRKVSVILGPRVLRREPGRVVNVAAELRAAGVPVAFGSMSFGGAANLPLAAAAAVRAGLSPDDALAALTSTAAEVAGLSGRLGRLARGDRADFVVFSGDPFEPTSRVLAVGVRGRLVAGDAVEVAP